MKGQIDPLHGLKENVIIGHLVPAGTGSSAFRGISSSGNRPSEAQDASLDEAGEAELMAEAPAAEMD